MNQQPLENVVTTPQVHSPHSAGFVKMGVDSFQPLSSLALQLCATLPFDTSAVSVDCLLRRRLIDPTLRAAVRFRNIGPNPGLPDLPHHFPAVVPLVGHDFHGSHSRSPSQPQPLDSRLRRQYRCARLLAPAFPAPFAYLRHPLAARSPQPPPPFPCPRHARALRAKCVRPFFILVIRASGSCGCVHSWLDPFLARLRSNRASCDRVGVSIPDAFANWSKNSWYV